MIPDGQRQPPLNYEGVDSKLEMGCQFATQALYWRTPTASNNVLVVTCLGLAIHHLERALKELTQ